MMVPYIESRLELGVDIVDAEVLLETCPKKRLVLVLGLN